MCSTPAALSCCTNSAPPVPFSVRMAEAGGAPWPKVSRDCATDLTAAVLMPSALRPVMSCRRDIPWSRYCLISSFMDSSDSLAHSLGRAGCLKRLPPFLGRDKLAPPRLVLKGAHALALPWAPLHRLSHL